MVGCSEFTRRNYLKSCAEAGMVESQGLATYQPSARFSSVSIGTPIGITSRAYKSAGSLPKSFSRNTSIVGRSHLSPNRSSEIQQDPVVNLTPTRTAAVDETLRSCPVSPRSRRLNFNRDRPIVVTNPFKLETDSVESYIRSRKPILVEPSTEKSDGSTPGSSTHYSPVENILQETKPMYSIRNMPLRNLDELRETIAIRRNYFKERQLGNNTDLGLDTTYLSSEQIRSPYSLRKSEDIETSRISTSPSPCRFEFEDTKSVLSTNSKD